ncbi:MAG: 16S rRNA (guanine(527)-N(7))-methyltransferase RsmG [Lachnospiraceae bacterium]|nr:16S rRNA (guanine(527)-N(7))-methyltransferase RsmG [Lachnospiraceae bacterium]
MKNWDLFQEGLKQLNISLSEQQLQQFETFYEDLVEKNKVMNLTAITEWEEVVVKHFLDSLSIVKIVNFAENGGEKKLMDLGTGGGFPGIPLKIAFPELEIVLADSLNKRITFLQGEIEKLGLKKITAVHGRGEELGRKPQYREQFDYCVSRAVANLSTLSEYCLPFVKVGGSFISYKAGNAEEELAKAKSAIHLLSGKVGKIESFVLGKDNHRTLIQIEKTKEISKKYPRKAGVPSKNPL